MKVFLWKEKQFFEINKKEEISSNTILVSDYEVDMINVTLNNNGHIWLDGVEVKFSGPQPSSIHDWDDRTKSWIINKDRYSTKLLESQDKVWSLIKKLRSEKTADGVYIESVDKVFQTDEASLIKYIQLGNMISLDIYEPVEWKTADNSIITLDAALFKEVQTAINVKTQRNFIIAESHKAEMMKANIPEEYDFKGGWV